MTPQVDVSDMLRLTGWRARAVFLLFTLTNAVNAIATAGEVRSAAIAIAALVVVTVAAALLMVPAPDPYPRRLTAAVVALTALASFSAWNVSPGAPEWSSWFWGAGSVVLLFLALRGRIGAAWIGMGLLAAVAVTWAITTGQTAWQGGGFIIRHVAMLLVGTFFAVYLRNTAVTIQRVHRAGLARARSQEGSRAAAEEEHERLERLRALADPALRLLASDAPLSDQDRREFRLLEACLRDWLRADALATPAVLAAARDARARGVDVTLLDDSGAQAPDPELGPRLERAVVEALTAQRSGELVVRVLPADRAIAATIRGIEGARIIGVDIPRSGAPTTPAPARGARGGVASEW